jgi:hypothetical protein
VVRLLSRIYEAFGLLAEEIPPDVSRLAGAI